MKRCPTCQSTYTDDSLRFCLQDGAALLSVSGTATTLPDAEKTLRIDSASRADDPPPTAILNPAALPTAAYSPKSPLTTPQQPRPTEASAHEFGSPPRSKNNALVIPVTIALTVLVLALGGLSAWLLFGNKRKEAAGNVRPGVDRTSASSVNASGSPAVSPPAATPPPAASPSPVDTAAVRTEVTALLNGWTASSTARDIDAHMSYYADTLEVYYNKRNISASVVRADRQRAYDTFHTLDISLSDIRITPDATTGERATAVFDKTWTFEGEDKVSTGSVQQELRLLKIDGRWRITGERDLQVYYVNK